MWIIYSMVNVYSHKFNNNLDWARGLKGTCLNIVLLM